MALQLVNDNFSYQKWSELPEFGVGRYDPAFESAAFALKRDGEISKTGAYRLWVSYHHAIIVTATLQDKTNEPMA